jgi:hypothetical protein
LSDQFIFTDVWEKNNLAVQRDAIAAWQAAGDRLGNLTSEARAHTLCVVGYDGSTLCATSTCQIRYMPQVRENMAFIQVFIVPDFRQKGLVIPLAQAFHATMSCYALEHPELKIGGTAARIVVKGTSDKPAGNTGMVLMGYSLRNEPLRVRWFDHYQLDEEAARARDPRKSKQSG